VLYELINNGISNCSVEKLEDYLVFCGPYSSLDEARSVSSKINKLGYFTVITEKIERKVKKEQKKVKKSRKNIIQEKKRIRKAFLGLKVKEMYDYLNQNKLIEAQTLAYSLLNTEFRKDALFVLALINMRRGNHEKACELFSKLPRNFKPNLEELKSISCLYAKKMKEKPKVKKEKKVSYSKELTKAGMLLAEGKAREAIKLAKRVLLSDPTNVEAMLIIGDAYMELGDYSNAYSYYKMALSFDKNNLRALKGLMFASAALKKFEEAYKYAKELEKLGVKDENIKRVKAIYFAKKAEELIKRKEYDKAYLYLKEAKKLAPEEPYVLLLLGDIYFYKGDYSEAYKYYVEAYNRDKNFDFLLKLLYTLANMNNFDLVNTYLSQIDISELNSAQRKKLKDFYRVLYVKASSYYLSQKDYEKAYKIAKEGLMLFPKERTLLKNLAWSCLNLEDYKCAEENFKKALTLNEEDYDALYGLALTYARMGKEREVDEIVKKLERKRDKETFLKIADLYVILGDYDKAEYYLNEAKRLSQAKKVRIKRIKIEPKEERKEVESTIFYNPFIEEREIPKEIREEKEERPYPFEEKKKEILELEEKIKEAKKKENTDFVEFGTKFNPKSGRKGLDKLTYISVYLNAEKKITRGLYLWTENNLVFLDSGGKPDYTKFGSADLPVVRDTDTSFFGIEPMFGVRVGRKSYLKLGLGSTPLGNSKVHPVVRGLFEANYRRENLLLRLTLKRDSIRESLLSYVGAKDPHADREWGRVIEQGGEVKFQLGSGYRESFLSLKGGYYDIKGKNVNDNSRYFFEVYASLCMGEFLMDENYLGLFFRYENYEKNENLFYFGNGGYFSPKNFLLIGPKYTGYFYTNTLMLRLNLLFGFLRFEESGKTTNTLGSDISGEFEYKLKEQISLIGGIGYRNSKNYDEFSLNLGLKYYFNGFEKPFRQTVDKIDEELFR